MKFDFSWPNGFREFDTSQKNSVCANRYMCICLVEYGNKISKTISKLVDQEGYEIIDFSKCYSLGVTEIFIIDRVKVNRIIYRIISCKRDSYITLNFIIH